MPCGALEPKPDNLTREAVRGLQPSACAAAPRSPIAFETR
jgi:hypothetical protein